MSLIAKADKVKHRILFPLGALTNEQAERLRLAIAAYSNPDLVVARSDDIVVTKHAAYLAVTTLHHLWQKWGFSDFFPADRWIEAMVLNRCLEPVTKIHIKEWMAATVLRSTWMLTRAGWMNLMFTVPWTI